jgi:hypothetical protein
MTTRTTGEYVVQRVCVCMNLVMAVLVSTDTSATREEIAMLLDQHHDAVFPAALFHGLERALAHELQKAAAGAASCLETRQLDELLEATSEFTRIAGKPIPQPIAHGERISWRNARREMTIERFPRNLPAISSLARCDASRSAQASSQTPRLHARRSHGRPRRQQSDARRGSHVTAHNRARGYTARRRASVLRAP